MPAGDGILTSPLSVLVPLEGDLPRTVRYKAAVHSNRQRTLAPAGMERVWTLAPERPFTLQVRSVEVTSVTGLLFGGTRMKLFWPSSTPLSQMYCIVTIEPRKNRQNLSTRIGKSSLTHSGRWRQWQPQPGRRGARASWLGSGSTSERRTEGPKPSPRVFYTFAAALHNRRDPAHEPVFRAPASDPSGLAAFISPRPGILAGVPTVMSAGRCEQAYKRSRHGDTARREARSDGGAHSRS